MSLFFIDRKLVDLLNGIFPTDNTDQEENNRYYEQYMDEVSNCVTSNDAQEPEYQ